MSLQVSIFVIILKRYYLAEIFQEFAEDNDTGALLASLRVIALCSIKLSSDGADTGVTVCSGA
jgi:hypothetical protein